MGKILELTGACVAFALALGGTGCVTQPTGNAPTNTTTTAGTPLPSPAMTSPTPASITEGRDLPVTLPVLDAFFADESFAADLKAKLQLTDEQVNKLRTMAREETAKLRETDRDEDYSGSTASALARSADQVRAIVGEEKAPQLAAFVRERWRTGGSPEVNGGAGNGSGASATNASTATPNSVPTDTRIIVNAPAYRMDVFEGGRLIKSYKIGIGYPEFPLPTGLRKANAIIFNPTWTPPDEPWVEGSSKVKAGKKVEAGSPLNPLGPIKIPIGSPSLIHGGKALSQLGGFASHGCVGLTTPQIKEFAPLLAELGGTEITSAEMAKYAKDKTKTENVKLSNPVPVELRYETIVVTDDGKLHIYRDVYDRDTNTEENLRAVLQANGVTLEQLSEAERTKVTDALKQMARDASGRADTSNANANTNANANASPEASPSASPKKDDKRNGNATDGRVTRTVKGKKEIVIEIAALKGKGYPAFAERDSRGASKKSETASTGARRQG